MWATQSCSRDPALSGTAELQLLCKGRLSGKWGKHASLRHTGCAVVLAKPSLQCFFVQAENIYCSLWEQIIGEEVLHHKGHSEKILGYAVVDFQGGA